MSDEEIRLVEFGKFKRELLASINQLTVDGLITVIVEYGEPGICEECGQEHKGMRCLSNTGIEVTFAMSRLLANKATEQLLGIDNNKWGKPKEN